MKQRGLWATTRSVFTAGLRDFSGRKAMEAHLRESDASFRSLVENSRDVIAVIDESGRCSFISPAITQVSGHKPEEVVGQSGLAFLHPDDIEAAARGLSAVVAEPGGMKTIEVRSKTKSGDWIWIEIRAANRLDDPLIRGIVVNYHDITDRRKAADRVAASERSMLEAQAISHFGSFSWDMESNVSIWSDDQFRLFGFEPDSIATDYKTLLACIHPDEREEISRLRQHCIDTGEAFAADFRVIQPDGSIRWIHGTAETTLENGRPARRVGISQDITQRKEADAERERMELVLRESEELFRGAFDASATGIALIDIESNAYLDVNPALCKLLGYSKEELMRLTWIDITHPDDLAANLIESLQVFSGADDLMSLSKRYVRKDGKVLSVEITDALVRDPNGIPKYCVAHVSDVTQRDKAIADQTMLEAQLRQAQKMEAVGQLAGGIAHDFNNLLAVILNYAEFLGDDMDRDDARLADVGEIIKAGDKAAVLIRQLLAFSRKEVVEPRVMDLNEVVADLHELLSRSLGEHIDLVFVAEADLPIVKADRGQLEQVLMNLAVNARDAMPNGGSLVVTTTIESTDGTTRLGLAAGAYARLTVSDTGFGMDESIQERVFEPFFTTKIRAEGTGLGLATVYGNVKQANGCVYVESEPGVGTSFSVYLPLRDEAVDRVEEDPRPDFIGGTESILLVEDEDAVRTLVSRILIKHGYAVTAFSDGIKALDFFRSHHADIDLLLTDVVMTKMSGRALSDQATAMDARLKTLFMSGYTNEVIAQRGVLDVDESLLRKPFKAEQLLAGVRSSLDEKAVA